jgi:DNA-binding transcriptional MerR regulator
MPRSLFDKIGLLEPSGYNAQGHRMYTDKDLVRLQNILVLKLLDYSLEEIAHQLDNPANIQQSLQLQVELIQKKRDHFDQILQTLSRLQEVVRDQGEIDARLLLVLIHTIQHEEDQQEWLSRYLPHSVVKSLLLADKSEEERLRMERTFTSLMSDLKTYYREGVPAEDPQAIQKGKALLHALRDLFNASAQLMQNEQAHPESGAGNLNLAGPFLDNPGLFPSAFSVDEEKYVSLLLEHAAREISKEKEINK